MSETVGFDTGADPGQARMICPLCRSALTNYVINSNNREIRGEWTGELLGFAAGNPDMTARCERGCEIHIVATQPLPKPRAKPLGMPTAR